MILHLASISTYNALPCDGQSCSMQPAELTESPTSCPGRPTSVFLQGARSPTCYSQLWLSTAGASLRTQAGQQGASLTGDFSLKSPSLPTPFRPSPFSFSAVILAVFPLPPPAFFPLSCTDVSYQILSWCQFQTNTVYKIKFFQVIQEERESFKNMLHPLSWEEWWNNENKIKKDRLIKLNHRIFSRQFRQIWNKKEYLEEQERDFFKKGLGDAYNITTLNKNG